MTKHEKIGPYQIMSPPVYPDFSGPAVFKRIRSFPTGPVLIARARYFFLKQSLKEGLYQKRLRDNIKGVKLILFEDAGHFLPIDIPRNLYDAMVQFMEE